MNTTYRSKKQVTRLMAGFSQLVRILRTARPLTSDCPSGYFGLPVRLLLSLLLLTASVSGAWGQKVSDGIYYIRNNGTNKGYLWPSVTTNSTTGYRYLTTSLDVTAPEVINNNGVSYPAHDKSYSHWVVKNVTGGYIQLINPRLNKYVVIRKKSYGDRDVWLADEASAETVDYTYFELNNASSPYKISPKAGLNNIANTSGYSLNSARGDDRVWLTWSDTDNKPKNGENRGGLIQCYSSGTPEWTFTSDLLDAPTISDVGANDTVTVTDANGLPDGYKIRYTTDGSIPTASSPVMEGNRFTVTSTFTLKAVVERYGVVLTEVAEKAVAPAPCATPVITYDNTTSKVSITSTTPGCTFYYTTNSDTPTTSSTPYNDPFSIDSQTTVIKAIATKAGYTDSEIASVKVVLNPTITLATNEYTYDGSAKEPAVSSLMDGETPIDANEYTVSYSDNTDAGTGTVNIKDKPGGKYIVSGSTTFTILRKAVTITANDASKTYDGTALTENGFTASELETGDTHTFTVTMTEGSTITNAGTEPNVIAAVDGSAVTTGIETAIGNYLVTTANGLLTISPKSLGDGTTAAEGITVEMTEDGLLNAVKDGSTTLIENTDYTQETVEEGSDKIITITGIGNYTGIVKGIYASPAFVNPDGGGSGQAAAVYQAKRDLSCPSGINPYIIRKVNPTIGTAVITKLDYIPVDVPVLLLSDDEVSGFVASPKDPSTPEVTAQTKNSNLLKMAPAEGVVVENAQVYMFYKGEFVLTKAGTITEGKFYLNNPSYTNNPADPTPVPARGTLMIVEEETTGLVTLPDTANKPADDVWYTLDGRRLNGKPANKGLYIKNGRKTVIK